MILRTFDPLGPAFLPVGRHGDEPACALWWSGCGVRTRLACTRLEIEVDAPTSSGGHAPWLAVEADGAPIARLPLAPGRGRYLLLAGMDPAVAHEIAILRDTQPTGDEDGPVVLRGVFTDSEPQPPRRRRLVLECLGDSLTAGEGALGPVDAMEWRMAWISNRAALPSLVARRLDAELRVVAMGGWGCWRGYDGDAAHRIGAVYDRLCAVTPGGDAPYDFAAHPVDAVVIGLGTNDASALDLLPESQRPDGTAAIRESAEALLRQVRAANSAAHILWTYGLLGDALGAPLRAAVEARLDAGDSRVHWLQLDDFGGDFGARQHPSRAAHRRAADQIADILAALINDD